MKRALAIVLLFSCIFLASGLGTMATFSYVPEMQKSRTVPNVLTVHLFYSYLLLVFTVSPFFSTKVLGIDSVAKFKEYKNLVEVFGTLLGLGTFLAIVAYWVLTPPWSENGEITTWSVVGSQIFFIWTISLMRTLTHLSYMLTQN